MCLFPRLMLNPKYLGNTKNKFRPPELKDNRVKYVPVSCGQCLECRKKKAMEWRVRLLEEFKHQKKGAYVTFTFSDQSIIKIAERYNLEDVNEIAKKAVRLFLERWRKKYKSSIKHWLITELGGKYDRIHLHGFIFSKVDKNIITDLWSYGFCYYGYNLNEKCINYVVKYLTKIDTKHKEYKPIICCSPGIGKSAINNKLISWTKFNEIETEDNILVNGKRFPLPNYYRNLLYNDEEKEKIWIQHINKQTRFVLGEKIRTRTIEEMKIYESKLQEAQRFSKSLGYIPLFKWDKKDYNYHNYKINLKDPP